MNWLEKLLEDAKSATGIASDRKLSLRLNRSLPVVSQWRVERNKPNDEDILQLALMAGRDPQSTLIEWHAQSAPTPAAQSVWKDISKALKQSAAALIFMLPLSTAQAQNIDATSRQMEISHCILCKIL